MKSLIKKLSTMALFAFVISSPVFAANSQRYTLCSNHCYNAHKCIEECGVINGKSTKDGQPSCTACRDVRTKCQNQCKE